MVGSVESGIDWHGSGAKLVAREDDERTKWVWFATLTVVTESLSVPLTSDNSCCCFCDTSGAVCRPSSSTRATNMLRVLEGLSSKLRELD